MYKYKEPPRPPAQALPVSFLQHTPYCIYATVIYLQQCGINVTVSILPHLPSGQQLSELNRLVQFFVITNRNGNTLRTSVNPFNMLILLYYNTCLDLTCLSIHQVYYIIYILYGYRYLIGYPFNKCFVCFQYVITFLDIFSFLCLQCFLGYASLNTSKQTTQRRQQQHDLLRICQGRHDHQRQSISGNAQRITYCFRERVARVGRIRNWLAAS